MKRNEVDAEDSKDADDADVDGSLVVEAGDSSLDSSLGTYHFNAVQHSQKTFKKKTSDNFHFSLQHFIAFPPQERSLQ